MFSSYSVFCTSSRTNERTIGVACPDIAEHWEQERVCHGLRTVVINPSLSPIHDSPNFERFVDFAIV